MRTIDADAFKKYIDAQEGRPFIGCTVGEAMKILIDEQPTVQPEPTGINAKEAVYNLAEKIGIHQLFALTVELRGEPIQPEPKWIPVERELPEDFTDVLVWFEYFRYGDYNCMYATHGIGNYSKEYNSWTINHETGWKDLHVFAWMPLPEPYTK